ncbi:MAG: acetoacetate--CoA ligase [Candidatus Marinimicrobia bacterium]|jgi:acetoacetyl-CoA synthetase|nr:acetoacetate--CoA ligase [Candidatus Neomarinimicrobiota bacterium]
MNTILWKPSKDQINSSQLEAFRLQVNSRFNLKIENYSELHSWSISNINDFWKAIWGFMAIKCSSNYNQVVDDENKMPGAKWFDGLLFNFAENILRIKSDKAAIIFQSENADSKIISYNELYDEVEKVASTLRKMGIKNGDRIVGIMPNLAETVIAMLATTSIGAIWSSCSPDFGTQGILDRFTQINPKIIFASDGYFYKGKSFDSLNKLKDLLNHLPSVRKVIITPFVRENPDISSINNSLVWNDFIDPKPNPIIFEQVPFDHPLYIMYSSGTTGKPKSIVHGAGGTLIQHLKELRLHTDININDTVFYFTTCGWMMWNWLVSNLAIGSTILLYDGSPFHPDRNSMWDMIDNYKVSHFGTSPKFLETCRDTKLSPIKTHSLKSLKSILSTGSPLVEECFEYVYKHIKKNIQLSSISGGTDIISCFALGNPILPVINGEIQCLGLGMDVAAFNKNGEDLVNKKGELVCKKAFPSMPVYFWNDKNGKKFFDAYFNKFKNVWHHGDFIEINNYGGVKIFGRSDATLNPGGIRIGTAEIYRVVDRFDAVNDSLVIGQSINDDERVILFIIISNGYKFSNKLVHDIKKTIFKECSPRHVPEIILEAKDIPYTINGKKVEIAVKKVINGENVENKDALKNPEALDLFKNIRQLKL